MGRGGNGKRTLDRNDELRDDGEDALATLLEHLEESFAGKELVRLFSFAESVEENREEVEIVQLLNRQLPQDLVSPSFVKHSDREVTAVIEPSEFCWPEVPLLENVDLRWSFRLVFLRGFSLRRNCRSDLPRRSRRVGFLVRHGLFRFFLFPLKLDS